MFPSLELCSNDERRAFPRARPKRVHVGGADVDPLSCLLLALNRLYQENKPERGCIAVVDCEMGRDPRREIACRYTTYMHKLVTCSSTLQCTRSNVTIHVMEIFPSK